MTMAVTTAGARRYWSGIAFGFAGLVCVSCPHSETTGDTEDASSTASDSATGSTGTVPDAGSDACKDAVVLNAGDFAEQDGEWIITSAEDAAPLLHAREVVGAIVVSGDAIDELPSFACLETVGTLWVQQTRLQDLTAFSALRSVREVLFVKQNAELGSLVGLGNLESVGGMFSITHNYALESMTGLSSLQTVGVFNLDRNDELWDLEGMPPIEADLIVVGGNIRHLHELADTTSDAYEVDSLVLESIEGLPIAPKMRRVAIGGGSYDTLAPLAGLEECSLLSIHASDGLASLDGLQSLQRIVDYDGSPGVLSIKGNPNLTDLSALANVAIIESALEIDNNAALLDLNGLESVASARQISLTANQSLQNVDALRDGALASVDEYIRITSNWALPECQGQAICAAFPNASCQVANNDVDSTTGC